MRTFYDFRSNNFKNPKEFPLQGRVILKRKDKWLIWIYRETYFEGHDSHLHGFIVAPRSIYLFNTYIGRNFIDALFYYLKENESIGKILNKLKRKDNPLKELGIK